LSGIYLISVKPCGFLGRRKRTAPKKADFMGSVIKKRRKKIRKHKHRKLLKSTRHQRRK